MSFADRLAKQLNEAPSKELYNKHKKAYDWQKESNQKRSVR